MTASTSPGTTSSISSGIVVVTDESVTTSDPVFTHVAELATASGVTVTLYDRSEETWGDSQHAEGPLQPSDERVQERPHLVEQMAWFTSRDVAVQAWLPSLPSISAILSALGSLGADTVVVSAELGLRLLERALEGDSLAQSIAAQIERQADVEASVFEVGEDGATVVS